MFSNLNSIYLRELRQDNEPQEINYCYERRLRCNDPLNLKDVKVSFCIDASEEDFKYLKWLLIEKCSEILLYEKKPLRRSKN